MVWEYIFYYLYNNPHSYFDLILYQAQHTFTEFNSSIPPILMRRAWTYRLIMSFMQQSYESHTASVTVEVGQSVSHFHRGGRLILSLTGLSLGLQISLMHRPIMLVFFFCEPSSIGGHGQPNRQVSQEAALNANVANTIIRSTFPLAINTGNMHQGLKQCCISD